MERDWLYDEYHNGEPYPGPVKVRCYDCGRYVPEDDALRWNGHWWCDPCWDEGPGADERRMAEMEAAKEAAEEARVDREIDRRIEERHK